MNKLSYVLTLIICLTFTNVTFAQKANDVLDKTAEKFKSSGGVKAQFTYAINDQHGEGQISLSEKKFFCSTDVMKSWYDGKDMWHYVISNEEVNVTTPTASETSRINPYSFLNIYKKGYSCSFGKNTSTEYVINMNGKDNATFKNIVVKINKKTYQPTYIKTVGKKVTTEVTIKSLKTGVKFSDSEFKFNKKNYPNVDIIDLR